METEQKDNINSLEERLKKLEKSIEVNSEMLCEMRIMLKGIKKYITMQYVWFYIKLVLIVIPVILSLIFLPPLLGNVLSTYQELLGIKGAADSLDASGLQSEAMKLLK